MAKKKASRSKANLETSIGKTTSASRKKKVTDSSAGSKKKKATSSPASTTKNGMNVSTGPKKKLPAVSTTSGKKTKQKRTEVTTPGSGVTTQSTNVDRNRRERGVLLNLVSVENLGLPTNDRPFLVEYFPSPEQFRAEIQVRSYELESQRNAAERVWAANRSEWETELSQRGQRASINVAYRTKLGHVVAPLQHVILVDVAEKLPMNTVRSRGLYEFPSTCCGIPVKVRQIRVGSMVGRNSSMAGMNSIPPTSSLGAIQGGTAITASGNGVHGDWGTLGICVPMSQTHELTGVTNYHVVGDPNNTVSVSIGRVGTVSDPVGKNPFCDAAAILRDAAATFIEGVANLNFVGDRYKFVMNDDLSGFRQLQNSPVFKVGAAMPVRVDGQITHLSRNVDVPDLSPREFLQVVEVQNNSTAFIQPGDSGSVLVQETSDGNSTFPLIIALNFAGSDDGKTSYAIPFGQVINKLNLTIDPSRLIML